MFEIPQPSLIDKVRFTVTSGFSKLGLYVGWKQKQIIVCGYPRGGTSLFYNMLSTTISDNYSFTEFEEYYIYHIHKLGSIATKAPLDIFHIKYLEELNIHEKDVFIFVVLRDIREVLTSRHPFLPDEYFIGYDNSWWPQDKEFNSWKYDAPGVIKITREIKKILGKENVAAIRYEDLMLNADAVQEKISDEFNMSFDYPFSKYYERSDKLAYSYKGKYQPVDSSLVLEGKPVKIKKPRWMEPEHKERIVDQFTSCPELFDILIDQGYEVDNKWFEQLPS